LSLAGGAAKKAFPPMSVCVRHAAAGRAGTARAILSPKHFNSQNIKENLNQSLDMTHCAGFHSRFSNFKTNLGRSALMPLSAFSPNTRIISADFLFKSQIIPILKTNRATF
jgi:hypothetical protein